MNVVLGATLLTFGLFIVATLIFLLVYVYNLEKKVNDLRKMAAMEQQLRLSRDEQLRSQWSQRTPQEPEASRRYP